MAAPTGVDGWIGRGASALGRTARWVLVNFGIALGSVAAGITLVAVPPLSLLPTEEPLSPAENAFVTIILGGLAWPVYLAIVARVSLRPHARGWALVSVPVLALPALLLPFVIAVTDATARSVVLGYFLYGGLCRLHPRRWRETPRSR